MIRLVLRPAALRDIAEIWRYTADQWGMDQADSYTASLHGEMARALAFPASGSPVEGLPEAYRKLTCAKHRVIYRVDETDLIVVRIIHERQDVRGLADDL